MKNPLSLKSVSQCKVCPLLSRDHVPSTGSPNAAVMFIGQSPGKQEVEQHQPFVGPAGEWLDFLLDEAELSREEVYIANVLKCRPPGNRRARPEEAGNCWREWLYQEIRLVDPKIVVCLGKDAHTQVMPKDIPFEHNVVTEGKKRVFITSYHPAYYLRRPEEMDFFLEVGQTIRTHLFHAEETEV